VVNVVSFPWSKKDSDHSPPSTEEIKNAWNIYLFYRLKHNICTSTQWWNINYIRTTCFGRKQPSSGQCRTYV